MSAELKQFLIVDDLVHNAVGPLFEIFFCYHFAFSRFQKSVDKQNADDHAKTKQEPKAVIVSNRVDHTADRRGMGAWKPASPDKLPANKIQCNFFTLQNVDRDLDGGVRVRTLAHDIAI